MQSGRVCDLTGKFAGETEVSGRHLDTASNAIFRRDSMKSGIDFNCCEIVGIEFQPVSLRQIHRIKNATPVFKAPRARADAYLLLIGQIQNEIATLANLLSLEKGSLLEM